MQDISSTSVYSDKLCLSEGRRRPYYLLACAYSHAYRLWRTSTGGDADTDINTDTDVDTKRRRWGYRYIHKHGQTQTTTDTYIIITETDGDTDAPQSHPHTFACVTVYVHVQVDVQFQDGKLTYSEPTHNHAFSDDKGHWSLGIIEICFFFHFLIRSFIH